MMTRWTILSLMILSMALVGCRQQPVPNNENVIINAQVDETAVGETELTIIVTDTENTPINDAQLTIRGDMTHAGMVPVLREGNDGTAGVYSIPFEWTMAGDWTVEIVASLPDGTSARRTFDFIVNGIQGLDAPEIVTPSSN